MASTKTIIVYTTVPTRAIAKTMSRELVKRKLVACANIVGPTDSIYRWKNTIKETKEFIVILKTTSSRFTKLQKRILELHPYECPCIITWNIDAIFAPYLQWIGESVL